MTIDPIDIPEIEKDAVLKLCRFLLFSQRYTPDEAVKIVDFYLNFLDAHRDLAQI